MNFYIKKKTKIHGPFSDKQIRGGIKSGKLKSDSLISDSSSGPWSTIGEALKTNPKYEALARPKAKTGKSSAPKSPSLPTTEATLLPDLEIPVLTDDAPPIAGTPEPPKAAVNSYWGQQNTPEQTAGQAVNSPQSTSGNSHQARLQSAKTKKTLLIVFGSIACVGTLLVGTVLLLILLPFLGHQSEIKQCRDKAKEMARHMARYNEELSKQEPNKLLLGNYEDRVYKLSREIGEIQNNWSDGEKEKFMVWVQGEGVDYARGFAFSRSGTEIPSSTHRNNSSTSAKKDSSKGKISFSLANIRLDGIYVFGDPQKGKQAALSTKMEEISARTESGFNTYEWDTKYLEIAFDQGSTEVELYDVKVSQNGSSLKFLFKVKKIIETEPSVGAETLNFINKNSSRKTVSISMEIPPKGFSTEAELKLAFKKYCQTNQFGAF